MIAQNDKMVGELLEKLEEFYSTSVEKGLSSEQVAVNREKFGSNALTPPDKVPEWLKFLHQFTNFFALLLLGGSLLCYIGFGIDTERPRDKSNLYLGVVLDIVVLITGIFSYMQEAKSEKIMEGFKNMIPKRCKVLRDGAIAEMEATEELEKVLETLTFREREIIKLRYGIGDGYTYTLEEVGRIFKVTRERVRQIEAKAVRKLQHPVRSRMLEGFVESDD